jgi:uncharacterized coiled-coil protein SlyX
MKKYDQEDEHFRMRMDDEVEDAPIPAAVDEMRLEKLNTRVTLISILIPVLIVIVLVITYLDIKKRVVQTEDTGTMSVQTLSKDVESRFSSLSLRQAELEEAVKKMTGQNDQSFAGIQVKLNKLTESLGQLSKSVVGQKELKAASAELTQKIQNVADALEEQQAGLTSFSEDIQSRTAALNQAVAGQRDQLNQLGEKLNTLEERMLVVQRDKIDKPAMDLALRLETLKLEQQLKARIDELQTRVEKLGKTISQRPPAPAAAPAAAKASPQPAVSPAKPEPPPPASGSPSESEIVEQTIPR